MEYRNSLSFQLPASIIEEVLFYYRIVYHQYELGQDYHMKELNLSFLLYGSSHGNASSVQKDHHVERHEEDYKRM